MPKNIPTSRDVTQNKETQRLVRKILTEWAGEISSQGSLNFGDKVEILEMTSRPVFFGKLQTLYESRGVYEKEVPLATNEHVTPQMVYRVSQVDPWALHVADHREFSPFHRDYVVPGSSVLVPCPHCHGDEDSCPTCGGSTMLPCPDCHGQGVGHCIACGGSGHKSCSDCDGKGFLFCPHCSGTGTTSRQETELSDQGVVENIRTITQPCVKCGGVGKVECRKCRGEGVTVCNVCHGKKDVSCDSCRGSGKTFCPDCQIDESECKTCRGLGKVKQQFVVRQEFIPAVEKVIDVDDHLDVFRRFYESLGAAHATLLMDQVATALPQDLLAETPLDEWYTETLGVMNSGDTIESEDEVRIKLQSIEISYITAVEVTFVFDEREYTYLVRMDTEKVFIQQAPEKESPEVEDPQEESVSVQSHEGDPIVSTQEESESAEREPQEEDQQPAAKKSLSFSQVKALLWTGKAITSLGGLALFLFLFNKPIFMLPFIRSSFESSPWAPLAYPWILGIISVFWICMGRGGLDKFKNGAVGLAPLFFELSRGAIIIGITAAISFTGALYGIISLLYQFVQLFV